MNQNCDAYIYEHAPCSHCPDVDEVVQWLDTMDLPSLYCSKKTVEVLRILRQLMDHWLSVVPQVVTD
jgi:hypothetical protein